MNKEEFLNLMNKYLNGDASDAEESALLSHYDALQKYAPPWDMAQMGQKEDVKQRLHRTILRDIKRQEKKRIFTPVRWTIAASILVAMLSAVLFFYPKQSTHPEIAATIPEPKLRHDILPGGNKAILTLSDGAKITLDDAQEGELVQQSGICITKAPGGQLVYTIAATSKKATDGPIQYNTIETPRGGQYQVVLPDGTKVWLNASSSLRYPIEFASNERKVDLTGEAYFEVVSNKHMPFRVVSNKQVVEVLGTHFNINAYTNEAAIKTTLLEGAVNVSLPGTSQMQRLQPGQQAVVKYNDSGIVVKPVSADEAIAWKKGYFVFADQDLKSIMRELARWYNVEIEYQGNITNTAFSGSVSRSKSITQVLRVLELTDNVHFKVNERRVLVMP